MSSVPGSALSRFSTRMGTVVLLTVLIAAMNSASAAVTFSGTAPANNAGQTNSATAVFSLAISGTVTNLVVTVSNVATYKPNDPPDILTSLFFTITGGPALTRLSAVLNPGSIVVGVTNAQPAGGIVGGEWAYNNGLSGAPWNANEGISASGLNLFGPHDLFPGTGLPGLSGNPPDGVGYGLTTVNDDGSQYNGGLSRRGFIKNGVVFALGNVPAYLQLSDISNVSFQYGTGLGEPNIAATQIPEPSTLALTSALIVILGLLYRHRH